MSAEQRVLSERYRVDEPIGRGGMASVYRGYDLTLGREVAIKILKRELADDPAFRTRFRLEAQSASRMSHPSIVRVFDAGEDVETDPDGSRHSVPYIVMELVSGRLLKDMLEAGPLAEADAVRYVDGILEALEYSHRAGVVHRDIKPGNVMITDGDAVKVMDFGIARAVSDSSSTVAETTAIIGTAAYFSPEQAKGEPVDARADLYSTGVVLYELLTGRAPFRGETPVAVAYQHVSEAPLPPSEVVEDVPRALDAIVLRALAKSPFQRFQDATEFRTALQQAIGGKQPSKRQMGALSSELYGPDPRNAAETARSLRQLSTDTSMRRTQSGPPASWIWAGVAVLAALLIAVLIWVLAFQPTQTVPPTSRVVPEVSGKSWDLAENLLTEAELTPVRSDRSDGTVPAGDVIGTEPAEGTTVSPGQRVTVYVSTGQEMAVVPTLENLSRDEATAALTNAGLQLGSVRSRNHPTLGAGTVIEASAAAGSELAMGSTVNLVVASGTVTLVDLTGYTVEAAQRELQQDALQLIPEVVEDPACPASPGGQTVAAQSLTPGEVPIGSTVALTVCTGA
ncbi:serine/threonine-protein kinase [Microbacterium imperiale]|uniref:non-specific serine/threonine protein kinase n=2 Tax=Microbacterium imperiale TaxID=33884 RepID=A0A9W6HGZ7_9MICO|nr:Stk1 family PASTA domain-containing Ser/Thr kinase [Microbacterium imperiale]MBP2421037.1 serine/threonine-protein kinase [Microbacterium imperiale]BFE41380.1 Stk1 family PASTA domain-containing Ser/Thr kinase [Microbacterium imperiale]GLJ80331.1 serine/threonine-protein kinase PknB [Microbacterium imperiale]